MQIYVACCVYIPRVNYNTYCYSSYLRAITTPTINKLFISCMCTELVPPRYGNVLKNAAVAVVVCVCVK
jgi:hypothetical protein